MIGRLLRVISLAYLAIALVLVVFFSQFMWFRGIREDVLQAGPLLLAVAALAGLALTLASRASARWPCCRMLELLDRRYPLFVGFVCAALFCAQMAIVQGAWFFTDWDAGGLVEASIYGIEDNLSYFSMYPNQLFLLSVFHALGTLFSDGTFAGTYRVLVIGGCACITAATALAALTARRLGGVRVGVLALALTVLLAGLSPWMLVPYSDAYGILFPVFALYLFAAIKRRGARMASVTFVCLVGSFVKPTVIFVLMAALLMEVLRIVLEAKENRRTAASARLYRGRQTTGETRAPYRRPAHGDAPQDAVEPRDAADTTARFGLRRAGSAAVRKAGTLALAAILAAVPAFGLKELAISPYDGLDENQSCSAAHYLMMGANVESNGRWTEEDAAFSSSFATREERMWGNLEEWARRVSEMGPVGIVKLLVKKTVNNYLDGTFWWEGEGSFYVEVQGDNPDLQDFFNIGHTKNWIAGSSENPTPYFMLAQGVWLFALLGCTLGLLKRTPSAAEVVACTALLGLSAFLLVFECRARYLFLYAPLFMIVSALGWQAFARRVSTAIDRRPRRASGATLAADAYVAGGGAAKNGMQSPPRDSTGAVQSIRRVGESSAHDAPHDSGARHGAPAVVRENGRACGGRAQGE